MNRFHHWFCGSKRWATAIQVDVLPWVTQGVDLGNRPLEVGPGPGRVTEMVRHWAERLTAIEVDAKLAVQLQARLRDTNVEVVNGDATVMPFDDGRFSGALCLTMLHHVGSVALQDRLLAEICRVLRPGGVLAGCDSRWSLPLHMMHWFDTMVLVDPDTLASRLLNAGFVDVHVEKAGRAFRFRARRPTADDRRVASPT